MGFNKHEDDIINFLTCGHISDIFGFSVDDSNADCEISDLVQQDIGENNSGASRDDNIKLLVTNIGSNNKILLDIRQQTPVMKQKQFKRTYRCPYMDFSRRHIACKDIILEPAETLNL